jgi:hypothetical protein
MCLRMEKKVFIFLAVGLFSFFGFGAVFGITGEVITGEVITGKATTGDFNISVQIVGFFTFNITSPEENTTYLFSSGENYTLDLNVSTSENITNWWYKLENADTDEIINDSVYFTPNTTILGILGNNRLTVTANSTLGALATESVIFTVTENNTSPSIGYISPEIFACEGDSLFYVFNITDNQGGDVEVSINSPNPFFVSTPPRPVMGPLFQSEIFSDVLDKIDAIGNKLYQKTISVDDGEYVDTAKTNITVIEINNEPEVEILGAQTVWAYGIENRTFYKILNISDLESDVGTSNISFNLSFYDGVSEIFNISDLGVMNFSANESYLGPGNSSSVFNLSLCVNDAGLLNPHVNISDVCGVTGESNEVCQNWSLTVTAENRPPRIESFSPSTLSFNASGGDTLFFNISEIDPDGTYPDARWYVSGGLRETDTNSLNDTFSYKFGCGVTGEKIVGVNVSDGELSDYLEWTVNVSYVACEPQQSPDDDGGGGGGGGGGGPTGELCLPLWACENWEVCQNTDQGLNEGVLVGERYRAVKDACDEQGWGSEICGFQQKSCYDVNNCNMSTNRPDDVQACYYTENPTCEDGIKNCHEGDCEVLVDCGGPCGACSTCSDGLQNQGEQGVDCGGPCPNSCEAEVPERPRSNLSVILSVLTLLVLLAVLAIKLYQIFALKKKSE